MIPKNDAKLSGLGFRGWLQYMYRVLATKVEHYRPTNGEAPGVSLQIGEVVFASGDDEVSRAYSEEVTGAAARWVGVVDNGGASGARVSVKTAGRVLVRFKDGETLNSAAVGTPVYVSDVVGRATMTNVGLTFSSAIGVLEDGSEYVSGDNPVAYVYLRSICGRGV